MAKAIKVISCPQCGSTQNTEIRPDFFRCSSCGTEYFLDNDDININYTYRTGSPTAAGMRKSRYLVFIFFGAVGLIVMFSLLFHAMNTSRLASGSAAVAGAAKDNEYSYWSWANTVFFRSGAADGRSGSTPGQSGTAAGRGSNSPLLVVVGKREYHTMTDDEAKNGLYLCFYDILERKELSAKRLSPSPGMTTADVQLRTFYNGEIFFTIDKKKVYRVDRSSLQAEDVTTTLFSRQAPLQTGIATVNFVSDNYGDGFSILTNDGKSYQYYPLVDRIYPQDEVYIAQRGFKTLLNGGSAKVYFTFTGKSFDYPDEKLQLLRISYKDNDGGPQDIHNAFSWRREYGVATEPNFIRKKLIGDRDKEYFRITDWRDLTPGRLYFDPQVIYGDSSRLLILLRANAAPDAPRSLQSLDPATGAVKWTVACSTDGKPDKALPFRDGFILINGNTTQVLDSNGTMKEEFKLK